MSEQPEQVQEIEAPEFEEHPDTDDVSEDDVWGTVHGPDVDEEA